MAVMATSMADHLRAQEYSRIRRSAMSLLSEPPVSEEAAATLAQAYEREDTSPEEYLAIVTEQRAFNPAPTSHAVVLHTGSYCSNLAVPVILKSFLQDHGNETVKDVLSHHGVAMLEKIPSGGILIYVRAAEFEAQLDGEEVNLLGKKFTIKRQSFLMNKFYLDVSGIHSMNEANALFLGLSALGARPLCLTPRDVNLETQVVTPTWRFYFGSATPPSCLMAHPYVTHQLVHGRHFYVARGKHSMEPPVRASSYRQSSYAVVLPFGDSTQVNGVRSTRQEKTISARISTPITVHASLPDATTATTEPSHGQGKKPISSGQSHARADNLQENQQPCADEQSSANWNSAGESNPDTDMDKQLESGFKRLEPSFAHENPFAALELPECEFEVIHPELERGVSAGIAIVPHLNVEKGGSIDGPAPTKKRATQPTQQDDSEDLLIQEALLLSEKEAQLMVEKDRIVSNTEHYKEAEEMLQGSKNMDRIVRSMTKFPLTWTKAILKDLVAGGSQTLDLAGIHLWNRISAEESMDDDNIRTFHERVSNLSLPMGNSRDEYTSYLKDAFNSLSEAQQKQWNLLRWLSIFELVTLSMCPAIFTQRAWLNYLVEHAGEGLPHTAVKLLSDQDLLQLLRSTVGKMILKTANKVAPGSALIAGLEALRSSPLTSTDLPF